MPLTDLVKVVSNDLPDSGPLQPDTTHVVVGDLHNLGQAEHAGVIYIGELVHWNLTQGLYKLNYKRKRHTCSLTVITWKIVFLKKKMIKENWHLNQKYSRTGTCTSSSISSNDNSLMLRVWKFFSINMFMIINLFASTLSFGLFDKTDLWRPHPVWGSRWRCGPLPPPHSGSWSLPSVPVGWLVS